MIYNVYIAVGYFVRFIEFMVLVSCILSWFPMGYNNPLVKFVNSIVDPLLYPIRQMLAKSPLGGPGMMLDISPIILLFIINGIYSVIGTVLTGFMS